MKFKTCVPDKLPLRSLKWESFVNLIGRAHATLARFDEVVSSVKNPQDVFSLLRSEEVLASLESQTIAVTVEELLTGHSLQDKNIIKFLNYQKALLSASKRIKTQPFSFSLLCAIHGTIKKDQKDKKKEIGRFRTEQNWIGPVGRGIEEAYYYPPDVKILHAYMDNLKKYFSYKERDPLVQLAILFAQLLVIHPFMDGNGRVGRVLIPLFLYKKKLISAPLFYLSSYFKKHRYQYFDKLFTITTEHKWEEWIHFFLKGIIEEGECNMQKARKILSLYQQFNAEVGDSKEAKGVIDALFACPILSREKWNKQKAAVKRLKRLEEKKWIVPLNLEAMVAVKSLLEIVS